MAGTRQILQRCRATENISKVTGTMETVSAVRYRKYYKKWLESIDFYDSLAQLAYLVVTAEKTIDHPLMYGNDSKCNAILAIGTDRGLCGGYNSNIYRQIETHMKMARRFGKKLEIYAQGKKVITHLNNRGIEITKGYDEFEEVPTAEQAKEIADDFTDQYLTGRIGRLGVEDLQADGRVAMEKIEGMSFIDLQESTSGTGHICQKSRKIFYLKSSRFKSRSQLINNFITLC